MEDRPAKDFSTAKLIEAKNYALNFIAKAKGRISSTGGWIARDANEAEIANAEKEIKIIDHELSLR
jgi:hypothetical protein